MPATKEQTGEQPIIFNDWSVRRILAGEKSQTRRVVDTDKLPIDNPSFTRVSSPHHDEWDIGEPDSHRKLRRIRCPYGQPGDVLWVREAFRLPAKFDDDSPSEAMLHGRPSPPLYCAGGTSNHSGRWNPVRKDFPPSDSEYWGRKRPSIHLPRELCRLRLRVEDVRVKRLQEISAEEVQSEGVTRDDEFLLRYDSRHLSAGEIYRRAFKHLWNEIHGTGAWDENPWVWVVEFSRIDTE